MNRKGQVLVVFLLLIPVLLMIFALVLDVGMVMTKTYKVKKVIKESITYGIKNNDIFGAERLLKENLDDQYTIGGFGNIEIEVKGSVKPIFSYLISKKEYEYNYKYLGYMENGKITIIEE